MDQLNDQDGITIEGLLYHIAIINRSDLDHLVLFLCSWATILSLLGPLGLLQSTCLICVGNTSFVQRTPYILCRACITYLYILLNTLAFSPKVLFVYPQCTIRALTVNTIRVSCFLFTELNMHDEPLLCQRLIVGHTIVAQSTLYEEWYSCLHRTIVA